MRALKNIGHIAHNTFREAVREKVLYVIVFFALAMVLVSRAIGWISVGFHWQVVKHFSLAIMSVFGALIAVFIGTSLIYKEIDKRTIYTILSKPVRRWEFLLGKFFGLLAVLFTVVAAMGAIICFYVGVVMRNPAAVHGGVDATFVGAMALVFFELMVVTATAVFFSTAASPILSAVFTFCAYLVGQVTRSLMDIVTFEPVAESVSEKTGEHLTDFLSGAHWLLAPLAEVLYYVLPNLSHFQARNRVVYGPPLTIEEFVGAVVYAVVYSAAVLTVATALFERKRF